MIIKNERLKTFLRTAGTFLLIGCTAMLMAFMVYLYVDEATYSLIVLILILLLLAVTLLSAGVVYIIYSAYKKGHMNKPLALGMSKIIRMVIPIAIELASMMKVDKNTIRAFFVDFNNIIVESLKPKSKKENILILVPHCLQWSKCTHKITSDPSNCRRCGKCNIDEIIGIRDKYGVNLCIASGGTMARKAIKETKPHVIISVACCRDLISGIMDVEGIPVVAVENITPEGPCINTKVDIDKLEAALKQILG